MKQEFEMAEVEVIEFEEKDDIVTLSGGGESVIEGEEN